MSSHTTAQTIRSETLDRSPSLQDRARSTLAILAYFAFAFGLALAGMSAPEGQVIDLASPLAPGIYLVANGGAPKVGGVP